VRGLEITGGGIEVGYGDEDVVELHAGRSVAASGVRGPSGRSGDILRPVSQQNVEKTEAFLAAYNARDYDAAVADFDPEIDWVLPAHQRSDSCKGPDEIRRFWDGLDETFDEVRLEPQETIDGGDRVAMRLRFYTRGKESGAVIEGELYHQVATFRDGKIVRIEYFTGWPEALEAAGLSARTTSGPGRRRA
jgi:ketosteroid isomerase-like protein